MNSPEAGSDNLISDPRNVTHPKNLQSSGAICLNQAIFKQDLPTVEMLLRAGVPLLRDKSGQHPLHLACATGNVELVRLILDQGNVDPNLVDNVGRTSLIQAATTGDRRMIQLLIRFGADVNQGDHEIGNTALHEAVWRGFSRSVELLCHCHADPNAVNRVDFTPLHLAAQRGHNQCARVLLYNGANVNAKNHYGDTPLHTAARYGHISLVRILLAAQVNLCEVNRNLDNPLHIAVALRYHAIAQLLVAANYEALGAMSVMFNKTPSCVQLDITKMRNAQGESPLDVARRKRFDEFFNLLEVGYTESVTPSSAYGQVQKILSPCQYPQRPPIDAENIHTEGLYKPPEADISQKSGRNFESPLSESRQNILWSAVSSAKSLPRVSNDKSIGSNQHPEASGLLKAYSVPNRQKRDLSAIREVSGEAIECNNRHRIELERISSPTPGCKAEAKADRSYSENHICSSQNSTALRFMNVPHSVGQQAIKNTLYIDKESNLPSENWVPTQSRLDKLTFSESAKLNRESSNRMNRRKTWDYPRRMDTQNQREFASGDLPYEHSRKEKSHSFLSKIFRRKKVMNLVESSVKSPH
ncbi:unnamed protein product [Calicophoron daubneyi]|uniref:Ankyrin repeat domain-containing protein 6 n=1 Tax=Calicophoron daubneyi TaxID=300641 RepID=A0AAV2T664_CALDB